jgi:uncharacterized protein
LDLGHDEDRGRRLGRIAMSSPHRSLNPRSSMVLDTHELGRRAGAMKVVRASVEAPADLGISVIGVPLGSPVQLDLRLESVVEGVLVSGSVMVQVRGDCVRCLGEISDELEVDIQELYVYPGVEPDNDLACRLEGDLFDLEPLLRDAVVLGLPFQPLCREDCLGLCVECGANLNDNPDHGHEVRLDPRWDALRGLEGGDRESYDVLQPAPRATKFSGQWAPRNKE